MTTDPHAVSAAPEAPRLPLAVIRLRGTQEEMGAQHAAALRALGGYREVVDFYSEMLERALVGADARTRPDWPVRKAVRAAGDLLMRRVERDRPAAYLARSRAFMEGLGLDPGQTRYLAVMDVLQNIVGLAGRFRLGPFAVPLASALAGPLASLGARAAVPACSTLMVWGAASHDGRLRHARNFDFPGIGVWDRVPAVVLCDPDRGLRYGFATARGADVPGVSAFNEAGITVTMHTRFHRDVAFGGAAVVDLGHDIARRAETLADAVAIARERQVASTWGVAVSSAREQSAVVIETTARDVAVVRPSGDHLSCANRYRHARTQAGQVARSAAWEVHSSGRQRSLERRVAGARGRGGMTVADLQKALDDRVDPAAPDVQRGAGAVVAQPCTVKSMVVDAEDRAVHISVGPAPTSRGPYVRVGWDWDGAVGGEERAAPSPAPASGGAAVTDAERAHELYTQACRLDDQDHDVPGAARALERAVALQPRDPSYRFLAGVSKLRSRASAAALAHFAVGLEVETAPLRRGQLLLFASRAADAQGERARARALRAELLAMDHEHLSELHALARAEERKPYDLRKRRVNLNLLFHDAW